MSIIKTSFRDIFFSQNSGKNKKTEKPINETASSIPVRAKHALVGASLLMAVIGGTFTCNRCSSDSSQYEYPQEIFEPVDTTHRSHYIELGEPVSYTVQGGDNINTIARNHDISPRRLLSANGLEKSSIIHPGDVLSIPETQTIVNVHNQDDVKSFTGFSEDYISSLCNIETVSSTIYKDRNGNETVGVGHFVKSGEHDKYANRELDEDEIYTLLAQDLLNIDLDFRTVINDDSYFQMPQCIKESVTDLMFNKGVDAVESNEALVDAINNKDYEKVIANLTQDYSVVTKKDGSVVHKPASGLSKRRLMNISSASRYFKGDIPQSILDSAKVVYERGLVYMAQEKDRGEIPENAYENVKAEYKDLAYHWFNGAIGECRHTGEEPTVSIEEVSLPENNSTPEDNIVINGSKMTVGELYKDWEKTAKKYCRPVTRPKPVIDSKANIVAYQEVMNPTSEKGDFKGKTFIINPGHGGASNHNGNLSFDPGASNAVMKGNNETNKFIGNNGIALEEWVVNEQMSRDIARQIQAQGGRVIFVQGSVYTVQEAINQIAKEYNINALISIHCNSAGSTRGIQVISNNRGGTDKEDKLLAENVSRAMEEHSYFRDFVSPRERSLAVLSKDSKQTLNVPGILIEAGNLKNEKDVANLTSNDYRKEMISAILNGTKAYLGI